MNDSSLIGLFFNNRQNLERFGSQLPDHLLEPETQTLIADLKEWYKKYPDMNSIDVEGAAKLWNWLKLQKHSNWSASDTEKYRLIIKQAWASRTEGEASDLLQHMALKDHAGHIAELADQYASGEDLSFYERIDSILDQAREEAKLKSDTSMIVTTDIIDIVNEITDLTTGLQWRDPNLQGAIGPIRKGDFGLLAAYTHVGKSHWVASELTHMATQLTGKDKVLLFNNEERGTKVKLRLIKAALGRTLDEIHADTEQAKRDYTELMHGDLDRIIVIDHWKISSGVVRSMIKRYNTRLVVFDQMAKVDVGSFGRHKTIDDLVALGNIFEWARGLAKEFCPVIGIHQAVLDYEAKRPSPYIELHQLAGSRQRIQAEADFIVTMGKKQDEPEARYVAVVKNKAETPGDELMRDARYKIYPDFERGRVL